MKNDEIGIKVIPLMTTKNRVAFKININEQKLIDKFVDKHGNIALSCAGEWLYQDDRGQVDALELVANILEVLSPLADEDYE